MTIPPHYIISFLIIFGWIIGGVVSFFIAKHNRKQTEKINIINQKNRLLTEVVQLVTRCYESKTDVELCVRRGSDIILKIEEIRKIYKELSDYHKVVSCESKIGKLRRLATLDIEKAGELTEEQQKEKLREIQNLTTDLEKLPPKF